MDAAREREMRGRALMNSVVILRPFDNQDQINYWGGTRDYRRLKRDLISYNMDMLDQIRLAENFTAVSGVPFHLYFGRTDPEHVYKVDKKKINNKKTLKNHKYFNRVGIAFVKKSIII